MYWLAVLAALLPCGVVTVTCTVPALAAGGAVAVTWVAEFTVNLVAATAPKCTAFAPVNLVPVIVTLVPPACGPLAGLIPVTAGGGGAAAGTSVAATANGPQPTGMVAVTVLVAVLITET